MNNPFGEYLELLEQLRVELEKLTTLAHDKVKAAHDADLNAIDQIMRQEQAAALSFRGIEQKQNTLLNAMGLTGVPLPALASNYPPKMRMEAKQVVERLQTQYQIYTTASKSARSVLECNLHEIERILASADAAPSEGPGYQTKASVEPPAQLKTDFRV